MLASSTTPQTYAVSIPAAQARETAADFATHHVADILHAGDPYLVVTMDGICWRVPLHLVYPALGQLGQAASVDVQAQTGQLLTTTETEAVLFQQVYAAFSSAVLNPEC